MVNVNDIKNGMTVEDEGNLYQVLDFSHVKPGKGAAFVKMKLKNLRTGAIVEKTYNSSVKLAKAMVQRKPMQYLYQAGDSYSFMDMNTYEQVELNANQIGDDLKYLKENLEVSWRRWPGAARPPSRAARQAPAGGWSGHLCSAARLRAFAGSRRHSRRSADGTLENGMTIKVPLFIGEGESVLVSTKDGKYVSRA